MLSFDNAPTSLCTRLDAAIATGAMLLERCMRQIHLNKTRYKAVKYTVAARDLSVPLSLHSEPLLSDLTLETLTFLRQRRALCPYDTAPCVNGLFKADLDEKPIS